MKSVILCALLLLAGCATIPAGVEMSEDEAKACKEQTCTVWTRQELMGLMRAVFQKGYAAGKGAI